MFLELTAHPEPEYLDEDASCQEFSISRLDNLSGTSIPIN